MATNTPNTPATTTPATTTAPAAAPAKGKAKAKASTVPAYLAKAVPAAVAAQAKPPAGAPRYKLGKPLAVRAGTMRATCMALVQHMHSTYRGGFYAHAITAGMVAQHGPKQVQARWPAWCLAMGIIVAA